MSKKIRDNTGVDPNTKCAQCKITAAQSFRLGPVPTGINHPVYYQTYSFYQSIKDGKHYCPRCHRENEIKAVFDAMDKAEARGVNVKKILTRS